MGARRYECVGGPLTVYAGWDPPPKDPIVIMEDTGGRVAGRYVFTDGKYVWEPNR